MKRVRAILRHATGEVSQDYKILTVMSEDGYYEVSVYNCATDFALPTLLWRKDGFTSAVEAEGKAKLWVYTELLRYTLPSMDWEFN